MKVSVCVGSSCHLKGSQQVIDGVQNLIEQNGLSDKVECCGSFCMGLCKPAVSVSVNDKLFSVKPEELNDFFEKEIKANL